MTSPPNGLQVLTFKPGIKGVRRSFPIRAMEWRGRLWLVAKDAGEAIGWHPDTFRHRREVALSGDAWGYATVPTTRGDHMMSLVDPQALAELLKGSTSRQARVFRQWVSFGSSREPAMMR